MTTTAKETKAQRVERLKRTINPWEGLDEIRRFAREGFDSIPPEWIGTYFRWWGVYTQGDGAGVTGGPGGGAGGDVTRNVTGCPVAGVDADEICDASPLALEASRMLAGNNDFYNLPRKFKISITGCRVWCPYPEINDIGLTATTRVVRGIPEGGFSLRVAGGLSTEPYLGARLNAFVRWNQVLPVIKGIAELFRDSDVLREHRERARLKFLFLRHGWTAGRFLGELHERIGFHLDPAVEEHPPDDVYRDHVGIHAQKQPGLSYVGAVALRGRITAEPMRAPGELADRL